MNIEDKTNRDNFLKRCDDMRAIRSVFEPKWDKESKDYQNEDDINSSQDKKRSKLKIPTLTAIVDSKLSDEIKAPFIVDFVPRNEKSILFKEVRQKIWDDVWYTIKGNLHRLIALQQKDVFGDSFIMAVWRTEKKKKKVITGFTDGVPNWDEKEIVTYDNIKLINIEPRFLLFDPGAQYVDEAIDFAYERLMGKEAFQDYYIGNKAFNQKNAKAAYISGVSDSILKTKEEDIRQQYADSVHVIDYFNIAEDVYRVYANDFLIYESPMPIKMLPIAHWRNRYKIGSFYSMSERDVVKDLLEEKDVHRNMVVDYNKANIHAPILKQAGVEFDTDSYRIEGNAVWEVGEINGVKRLETAPIINSAFGTENMFDSDITKASGVDISSLVGAQEESATKTISKKRNQLSRLEPMMKYNSLTADERIVKIIMEYVDTYYPVERVNAGLNDEQQEAYTKYRQIRVEDAVIDSPNAGEYKFKPKKGAVTLFEAEPELFKGMDYDVRVSTIDDIPVSKELKQQKAIETLQIMGSLPIDPNTGKLPRHIQPFVKQIIESGDYNKKDFEHLFDSVNENEASPEMELQNQLSGMGIKPPVGNQQPGRVPTPQELTKALGQKNTVNAQGSGAELGQLTSLDAGI